MHLDIKKILLNTYQEFDNDLSSLQCASHFSSLKAEPKQTEEKLSVVLEISPHPQKMKFPRD